MSVKAQAVLVVPIKRPSMVSERSLASLQSRGADIRVRALVLSINLQHPVPSRLRMVPDPAVALDAIPSIIHIMDPHAGAGANARTLKFQYIPPVQVLKERILDDRVCKELAEPLGHEGAQVVSLA